MASYRSSRSSFVAVVLAMQAGLADSEAYLAEWRTGHPEERTGTAQTCVTEAAAELEEHFGEIRTKYLRPGGAFNAH